jgi:hypothetical protein
MVARADERGVLVSAASFAFYDSAEVKIRINPSPGAKGTHLPQKRM